MSTVELQFDHNGHTFPIPGQDIDSTVVSVNAELHGILSRLDGPKLKPLFQCPQVSCQIVPEMGLQDKISFKGHVRPEEVFGILASADVFLHHSITARSGDKEGIPNAIMEAMATGLPVVSTYHSGIPELVDNGTDGYLVGEKDVPSYVEAMKEAVNSDSDLPRRASEKVLKSFNLETQNRKISDLYGKLIGCRDN